MATEDIQDEEHDGDEQHHWRFTIWHAIGLVVLFTVLNFLLYIALTKYQHLEAKDISWIHIAVVNGVSGVITAWAGAMLTGYSLFEAFTFEDLEMRELISAFVAVAGISILTSELNNVLQWIQPLQDLGDTGDRLLTDNLAGVLFAVAFVAPVTEELIFRGIILDSLRESYLLRTSIFATSLLFAIVHVQPWMMVNAFLIGLFLALIRLRTGSLMLCVLIHGFYNALPFLLTRVFSVQIPGFTPVANQAVQFQPWWFDVLGLLLLLAGMAGLRLNTHSSQNAQS